MESEILQTTVDKDTLPTTVSAAANELNRCVPGLLHAPSWHQNRPARDDPQPVLVTMPGTCSTVMDILASTRKDVLQLTRQHTPWAVC